MMDKYPYIFVDDDKDSDTYGEFCVMESATLSYDGFKSFEEAVFFMENL